MKLFTKEIDTKLFEQYLTGSDLENQMVVAKIFNPYGRGTWYLLNSDPEDPEYLWAIVDMDDIEVGSVNRSDLENIRIKPFMLGLERDLSFRQMNALELYKGLNEGKKYLKGGSVEAENKEMVLNNNKQIAHHTKEISAAVKNAKNVPAWVVAKVNRSASDLSDATHYMEGQGESYADGGGVGITESDIIEGVSFKNKSGTTFVIDKIELDPKFGKLVSSSLLGGKKGNYRDGITDFIAFLNEEKAVKYETGGGVEEKWQIKDSNDKYFSVSMQTGNPVWNESPDLGYSYKKQEAEKIKDKLVGLGTKDLKVVEYNPNWWKMKTGGGVGNSSLIKISLLNMEDSDFQSLQQICESNDIAFYIDESEMYVLTDIEQIKKTNERNIALDIIGKYDIEKMALGGGVGSIKITKNEFQFRKDEPKRVYHSYEGTLGDYIFYAETDNSFKSGYGSYGINKGSIYKLSIRKVLDNGMHDSIAEYWNKWDYRTKNAKDGAIRSKIIKYIDSISDEKKGTPKKYKQGGEVESKVTGWKHKKK